jgi:penicillin V acylase-like amidase (Ntn superfamily)
MCTSFVYRKEKIIVGMNFDNNGKDFKISANQGFDFLVSVNVNNMFFPSIGINRNGIFVNDIMVDSNGAGKYKRQNDKRWVTTSFVKFVLGIDVNFEDIKNKLQTVEIVNTPNSSTHNMIVDRHGNVCVVEPGRKNIFTEAHDSDWYIMTNFPLSDYDEIVPQNVAGSGSDRYLKTLNMMTTLNGQMTVKQGFEILKSVKQNGPVWTTELSLIYDATTQELFYCLDQDFDVILKYDFDAQNTIFKRHQ